MIKTEADIIKLIKSDSKLMNALRIVRTLNLLDWAIAAGVVRNLIWDELHGYKTRTPWTDVDVVYFSPKDINELTEKQFDQKLKKLKPNIPWSCKNQARMGLIYGKQPYSSTKEGIASFCETATAIGVTLTNDDQLIIISPYGIEDLKDLIIKPSPFDRPGIIEKCRERVKTKNWLNRWPKLKIDPKILL